MTPAAAHECFLSEEDRTALRELIDNMHVFRDLIKVVAQIKGGVIKAFVAGAFLTICVGSIGLALGMKYLWKIAIQ